MESGRECMEKFSGNGHHDFGTRAFFAGSLGGFQGIDERVPKYSATMRKFFGHQEMPRKPAVGRGRNKAYRGP
jgi:hypothetical protein